MRQLGVNDLVVAARSLGLDAGWDRVDETGPAAGVALLRAWVDDYEASRLVVVEPPPRRPVLRQAKDLFNNCLLARGAFEAVYDTAVGRQTSGVVPAAGSRSAESYPSSDHRELVDRFAEPSGVYAQRGLHACLLALLPRRRVLDVHRRDGGGSTESTITGRALQVHDAWVQDEWSFAVVYDNRDRDGRLGFRACVLDHSHPGRYAWMYGDDLAAPPDPVRWGSDTATFDIAEPLGTVAAQLRYDEGRVGWWGEARPHDGSRTAAPRL